MLSDQKNPERVDDGDVEPQVQADLATVVLRFLGYKEDKFRHQKAGTGLKFSDFEPARVLAIELEPTSGSLQLTAEPVGPQLIAQA